MYLEVGYIHAGYACNRTPEAPADDNN